MRIIQISKVIDRRMLILYTYIVNKFSSLKGSIIGDNCVIAAGSVVKGTFPSNSLIAGNPAKVVKYLEFGE